MNKQELEEKMDYLLSEMPSGVQQRLMFGSAIDDDYDIPEVAEYELLCVIKQIMEEAERVTIQ